MSKKQKNDIFAYDLINSHSNNAALSASEYAKSWEKSAQQHHIPIEFGGAQNTGGAQKMLFIGVGGAGIRLTEQLPFRRNKRIQIVAVSTDAEELAACRLAPKCLIGKFTTRGAGTGSDPLIGRAAVVEDHTVLEEYLHGASIVFFVAGLGGGTGTGAVPAMATLARQKGALAVALVAMPGGGEGLATRRRAFVGLNRLRQTTDALLVIRSDLLEKGNGALTPELCRRIADEYLLTIVSRLEMMSRTAKQDDEHYESLDNFLYRAGTIAVGTSEHDLAQNTAALCEPLFNNPLSELRFSQCEHALIHVVSAAELDMQHQNSIIDSVFKKLMNKATVSHCFRVDARLKGKIQLTLLGRTQPSVSTVKQKSFSKKNREDNGYRDLFDIREVTLPELDTEYTPVEEELCWSRELQRDLEVVYDAARALLEHDDRVAQLCTISETCSQMAMSAEIILNQPASELLHAAVEVAEAFISGQIQSTETSMRLFQQFPYTLEGSLRDGDGAAETATALTAALKTIMPGISEEQHHQSSYEDVSNESLDESFFFDLLDA